MAKILQIIGDFPSGGNVDPSEVKRIVDEHIQNGETLNEIAAEVAKLVSIDQVTGYFTSLEEAKAAAATAEPVGSTNAVYYYGQKFLVYENDTVTWYTVQPDGSLVAEGAGQVTETVSLLIDGVNHAVDNVSDPEATGMGDEYSLEITN